MPEQWREIPGYEGYYEVSDVGGVRSVDRDIPVLEIDGRAGHMRRRRGRRVVPNISGRQPYLGVKLWRDGKCQRWTLHRLVAVAFIGPRPTGLVIRHLNGNPLDNRVENLRYGTYSENAIDTINHGNNPAASKKICKWGHEFTTENTRVRIDARNGRTARSCLKCEKRNHDRQTAERQLS